MAKKTSEQEAPRAATKPEQRRRSPRRPPRATASRAEEGPREEAGRRGQSRRRAPSRRPPPRRRRHATRPRPAPADAGHGAPEEGPPGHGPLRVHRRGRTGSATRAPSTAPSPPLRWPPRRTWASAAAPRTGTSFWNIIKQPAREKDPVAALERAWERYESRAKGIMAAGLERRDEGEGAEHGSQARRRARGPAGAGGLMTGVEFFQTPRWASSLLRRARCPRSPSSSSA